MNLSWLRTVALATSVAVCAACGLATSQDGGTQQDASSDAPAFPQDAGNCLLPGNASIQVMLQIAPGVAVDREQVWLAAMCVGPDGERSVRVVRADGLGWPVTLSGLGAGTYVVRASAMVVPGAASPPITLSDGQSSIVPLTLAPGDGPIALLDATGQDAGVGPTDAGAPADAAAASDGGADGTHTLSTPVYAADGGAPVAVLEATVEPRDASSFDVTASVRGLPCAGACVPVSVSSVEMRAAHGGTPTGLAVAAFPQMLVRPNETVVAPRRTLPGALGSAADTLSLALFGVVVATDGGAPDAGVYDASAPDASVAPDAGAAHDAGGFDAAFVGPDAAGDP